MYLGSFISRGNTEQVFWSHSIVYSHVVDAQHSVPAIPCLCALSGGPSQLNRSYSWHTNTSNTVWSRGACAVLWVLCFTRPSLAVSGLLWQTRGAAQYFSAGNSILYQV